MGKVGNIIKAKPIIGQDVVNGIGRTLDESGQVVKIRGTTVRPITIEKLRANPRAAIEQAARYSHGKAVNLANKYVPGLNVEPFSKRGVVVGVVVNSGIGVAKEEGKKIAVDKISRK
jgi:hypothetical protein